MSLTCSMACDAREMPPEVRAMISRRARAAWKPSRSGPGVTRRTTLDRTSAAQSAAVGSVNRPAPASTTLRELWNCRHNRVMGRGVTLLGVDCPPHLVGAEAEAEEGDVRRDGLENAVDAAVRHVGSHARVAQDGLLRMHAGHRSRGKTWQAPQSCH